MVRVPVEVRAMGLSAEPTLPDAVRVRSAEVIAVVVRLARIAPAVALRVRLAPVRVMGAVMFMSPVVWVREREPAVPERGR